MKIFPHQPNKEAIGSQLGMPNGSCIFEVTQKWSDLMYWATRYMKHTLKWYNSPLCMHIHTGHIT